ncbi:expressed unknown protein [Seminavis robusta]|uniref:Uncharacterized protein n=1 Tax=Seminavis robusta TaxID=568900 RepID=A0A9N8EXP5_9STRA|nr:expressed unknown protein [Seminavis robusta]|eukprot:Sro2188_g318180.1 n/a (172) ;mRNA; f:176-691
MEETEPEEETETEPEAEEVAELETQETPAPTEVDEMDEIAMKCPLLLLCNHPWWMSTLATIFLAVNSVSIPALSALDRRFLRTKLDVIADAACYHPSNFANLTDPRFAPLPTLRGSAFDGKLAAPARDSNLANHASIAVLIVPGCRVLALLRRLAKSSRMRPVTIHPSRSF